MPQARSKIVKVQVRWYLSDGDEQCPHCGQFYAYELELRCPDCDEPSCPHCKCPGCVAGEGDSHGG